MILNCLAVWTRDLLDLKMNAGMDDDFGALEDDKEILLSTSCAASDNIIFVVSNRIDIDISDEEFSHSSRILGR